MDWPGDAGRSRRLGKVSCRARSAAANTTANIGPVGDASTLTLSCDSLRLALLDLNRFSEVYWQEINRLALLLPYLSRFYRYRDLPADVACDEFCDPSVLNFEFATLESKSSLEIQVNFVGQRSDNNLNDERP